MFDLSLAPNLSLPPPVHLANDQQDLARGSKWIYAMQTCGKPTYVAQLESQLRTWAANANVEERLLIIGGPHDNGQGQLACSDGPDGKHPPLGRDG